MGRRRTRDVENRSKLFLYNKFHIKGQAPSTVLHSFPQPHLT
jgi:hypothetical protein